MDMDRALRISAAGMAAQSTRLRVVADPASVDPRFMVDEATLDRIRDVVAAHWPEQIATRELQHPLLIADVEQARAALLQALDVSELR